MTATGGRRTRAERGPGHPPRPLHQKVAVAVLGYEPNAPLHTAG
jgi:hypothetical protein